MRPFGLFLFHLVLTLTSANETCDRDRDPCCCFYCNMNQVSPPENIRCFFQNVNKYSLTEIVSKGSTPVNVMHHSSSDEYETFVETVEFENENLLPNHFTVLDLLTTTNADAFLVMHQDEIVYERYWNQTASTRHAIFSCTKSYFALTAAMLAHEGKLDPEELVVKYIPELSENDAFEGATVRHIMDMSIAIDFDESVYGPGSDNDNFYELAGEVGIREAIKQYIQPHPTRAHGEAFEYCTPITGTLGWILDTVLGGNGQAVQFFQDKIWSKLGQEHDFILTLNGNHLVPMFANYGGGGLATARDMLRFGKMMLNMGKTADGEQIVPREVVRDIMEGGTEKNIEQYENSRECKNQNVTSCGMAYRNMFRVNPLYGTFEQSGIHGQIVHVDTKNNYVAVKHSSNPNSVAAFPLEAWAIGYSKLGLPKSGPKSKKSKASKVIKGKKEPKRRH